MLILPPKQMILSPKKKPQFDDDPFFDLFDLDLDMTSLPEDDHMYATDIDEISSIFDILAENKPTKFTLQQQNMMKTFGFSSEKMDRLLNTKTSEKPVLAELPSSFIPLKSYLPSSAARVDPRCFELTSFSKGEIDLRIPSISIPKMDQSATQPLLTQYHDPSTCDICQSKKTPQRKAILHKWRIRRQKRNWTKGPRYNARSSVATNRIRVNGRFVSCWRQ